MPALRDYQRAVAAALLSGDTGAAAAMIGATPDRLRIHRNTMLTALANAMALTFPAVETLVGAEFFAQTARAFIQAEPPRAALLSLYGGGFADFLAGYAPVGALPYLPDVARLEWAVERAAHASNDGRPLADIDLGGTRLALLPSLTLLETHYPAEPIWRAALDADGDALSRIDMAPIRAPLAIWRADDGAAVSALSATAGAFLTELLAGGEAEAAINAAASADPAGDPIAAITREVLPAGFVRLSSSN